MKKNEFNVLSLQDMADLGNISGAQTEIMFAAIIALTKMADRILDGELRNERDAAEEATKRFKEILKRNAASLASLCGDTLKPIAETVSKRLFSQR